MGAGMRMRLITLALAIVGCAVLAAQSGTVTVPATVTAGQHAFSLCAVSATAEACTPALTATTVAGVVILAADHTLSPSLTGYRLTVDGVSSAVPLSAFAAQIPPPAPTPTPAPTPAPAPAPVPAPIPTQGLPAGALACGDEYSACTWAGGNARTLFYGANGIYISRTATSPAACSNSAFGSDPVPNNFKRCYLAPDVVVPQPPAPSPAPAPAPAPSPAPTPAPPPNPPVPLLPTVTMRVVTCALAVSTNASPDGTTGWGVQYQRNGSNHGSRDTASPYERAANVSAGSYTMSAIWTKSGAATITQALGTVTCP